MRAKEEDRTFVGRADELYEIRRQAERALGADPRLVVVVGDMGIGKTALIHQSLASLGELQVLRGSGEESETDIPFALLGQLFGDRSPIPAGTLGEPFAVGADLLHTLGELQDTGPVALVVDDAHWVDDSSMSALLFAMRRLRADRVLIVLAVRSEQEHLLPAGITRHLEVSGRRLPLPGLSISQVAELVSASGAAGLPRWAVRRLWEHTGGNPLWVRALVGELQVDQLAAADLDLPAPAAFTNGVRRKIGNCSAATRELVAAASVMGGTTPLGILSHVADLDDPFSALDEARRAGLLTNRGTPPSVQVSFPHPLIGAAIYHDLDIAPRAALHRRAATVVEDEAVRIRHHVAACIGTDESLARRVKEHAMSRRAGAFSTRLRPPSGPRLS